MIFKKLIFNHFLRKDAWIKYLLLLIFILFINNNFPLFIILSLNNLIVRTAPSTSSEEIAQYNAGGIIN